MRLRLTLHCGGQDRHYSDILQGKIFGVAVSLLMLIIGLVLIAFDLMPAYIHARKRHGMVWLGLYAALIGVWSLIETNAVQFFVDDMRILQLIDNMIMIVGSMPLLLYLNCEYQIFKFRFMRLFCYADAAYILVSATMQLSGAMICTDCFGSDADDGGELCHTAGMGGIQAEKYGEGSSADFKLCTTIIRIVFPLDFSTA